MPEPRMIFYIFRDEFCQPFHLIAGGFNRNNYPGLVKGALFLIH